jgi:2-C-methyl-D-erythritol 4-phosphate cytidylyltransferase
MNIAVIFAGGIGKRMHSKDLPKQFLKIHGKPIIIHTLELFDVHPGIDAIVVACIKEWIPYLKELVRIHNIRKVKAIVCGGRCGQESIYNGLIEADKLKNGNDIVLIHDGVRPLINSKTITDNIESVKKYGSSITSVKVKETVLMVDEKETIIKVPKRECSRLARAPQSFFLRDILLAHKKAISESKLDFIDSCSLMQYYGFVMHLIEGPQENIKITTPDDFYSMRAILDAREDMQIYGIDNV